MQTIDTTGFFQVLQFHSDHLEHLSPFAFSTVFVSRHGRQDGHQIWHLHFIHSKKLQKSRLFLRTSGFFGTPDAIRTHGLWSRRTIRDFSSRITQYQFVSKIISEDKTKNQLSIFKRSKSKM